MIRKTTVMEIIKAHMDGEDKNTKAVLSDVMESVNELEALSQEPTEKPMTVDEMEREYEKSKALFHKIVEYEDAISRDAVLNTEYQVKIINDIEYVMLSEVQMKIRKMPPVTQKSGKWIPVSERLPEKEGRYLVWAEFCYIPDHVDEPNTYELDAVASYIGGKWYWYGDDVKRIIAWMPLPEPYKAEREEKNVRRRNRSITRVDK